MIYLVTIEGKRFEISIDDDTATLRIDGCDIQIDSRPLRSGRLYSILADNINYEFSLERSNDGFDIWYGSRQLRAEIGDEKSERFKSLMGGIAGAIRAETLKAPMPGLIVKVEVEVGQHVKKGDGLVIVEAMKMENELKAHAPAIIKEIKVKPGNSVEKNQVLLVFER
jgi:acetyl/propionyl-CoA carboxylase alpha subunit